MSVGGIGRFLPAARLCLLKTPAGRPRAPPACEYWSVRYYAVTGVAGSGFATAKLLTAVQAKLVAAGATDVNLEIVSGVVVGVGFAFDAETVEGARERAQQMLWATSLDRVGQLEIACPVPV